MAWIIEINVQCFDGKTFERVEKDCLLFVSFMNPVILAVSFMFDPSRDGEGTGKKDAVTAAVRCHENMLKGLEILGRMS